MASLLSRGARVFGKPSFTRNTYRSFSTFSTPKVGASRALALGGLVTGLGSFYAWTQCNPSVSADEDHPDHPRLDLDEDENNLSDKEFRPFALKAKAPVTHNSSILSFEMPKGKFVEFPVASFVLLRKIIDGKEVVRPYTPISGSPDEINLLVKHYANGNLSKYLGEMQKGDTVEMKGPLKKITYKPNMKKHIAMIAGGTGLTPMLQVLESIQSNPSEETEVSFIFANVSEQDILFKEYLDTLALFNNCKITYVLDKAPSDPNFSENFRGDVGHINKDMLKKYIPGPEEDVLVMVCGPPPMYKAISGPKVKYSQGPVGGLLKELGYTEEQVFKF